MHYILTIHDPFRYGENGLEFSWNTTKKTLFSEVPRINPQLRKTDSGRFPLQLAREGSKNK